MKLHITLLALLNTSGAYAYYQGIRGSTTEDIKFLQDPAPASCNTLSVLECNTNQDCDHCPEPPLGFCSVHRGDTATVYGCGSGDSCKIVAGGGCSPGPGVSGTTFVNGDTVSLSLTLSGDGGCGLQCSGTCSMHEADCHHDDSIYDIDMVAKPHHHIHHNHHIMKLPTALQDIKFLQDPAPASCNTLSVLECNTNQDCDHCPEPPLGFCSVHRGDTATVYGCGRGDSCKIVAGGGCSPGPGVSGTTFVNGDTVSLSLTLSGDGGCGLQCSGTCSMHEADCHHDDSIYDIDMVAKAE